MPQLSNLTRSVLFIAFLALAGLAILALGGCSSSYEELKDELMKSKLSEPAPIWDTFAKNGVN